jgi:hypothetical protein
MPQSPINEALARLQNPSQNHLSGKPLDALEALFDLSRSSIAGFREFLEELLRSSYWKNQDFPSNPYPALCLGLASLIDSHAGSIGGPEPAYHSRKHFQDVCLALTVLLAQPTTSTQPSDLHDPWAIAHDDAWILLFCAVAHDFGHDGSINKTPFQLEKSSIEKTRIFLSEGSHESSLIKALWGEMEPIILATEPSFLSTLLAKFTEPSAKPTKTDCMSMLLVEADLLASVLPMRGRMLGKLLGQEWESNNPKAAATVASDQGRLKFLEYIRFMSPHAMMLKMEDIRYQSMEELKG